MDFGRNQCPMQSTMHKHGPNWATRRSLGTWGQIRLLVAVGGVCSTSLLIPTDSFMQKLLEFAVAGTAIELSTAQSVTLEPIRLLVAVAT